MAEETVTPPVGSAEPPDAGRPELNRNRAGIVVPCVGLLIALVLPELPLGRLTASAMSMRDNMVIEAIAVPFAITAILLVYILFVERRSVSSIGLRLPTWKSFAFGIAVAVILVVGGVVTISVLFPALHRHISPAAIANLLHTPWWFRLLLATRAAVFEEVCYRGYMIERVQELTGRKWIALAVSVAAFTYFHLSYFGWAYLIFVGFGGVVLGLYYIWRRDLASNMVAHFLADGVLALWIARSAS
jgi:membrane protease YdiL (CAAX protease family)